MLSLTSAALSGFFIGTSLIIAIGAQNAFILRQGLLRQHVFILCLICAIADSALIALGVAGFGTFIRQFDGLITVVTIGGALFLFIYGLIAFRRAFRPEAMAAAQTGETDLAKAISICLAFTFLNPHVYLDTVILLGGLSAQYAGLERLLYGVGAATGSIVWFFTLGYGARILAPLFENPRAWQVLDIIIGLVMWFIAATLVFSL